MATNLPEIAITASALAYDLGNAIGNTLCALDVAMGPESALPRVLPRPCSASKGYS